MALGAGAEALLGRVEGALVQGQGGSGPAYAAARRSESLPWTVYRMEPRFRITESERDVLALGLCLPRTSSAPLLHCFLGQCAT